MRYLILAFLFLSSSVSALDLGYFPKSFHYGECSYGDICPEGGYNEDNNVIALQWDNITIMYFTNSFHKDSVFVGHTEYYHLSTNVRAFATVGIVSGYSEVPDMPCYGSLCFGGYIGLDIHDSKDSYGLVISANPGMVSVGMRVNVF